MARGTRRAHPGLTICRHFVAGQSDLMLSTLVQLSASSSLQAVASR